MKIIHHIEASPEHDGMRLDIFLTTLLSQMSRSYIQILIHQGHVTKNEQCISLPKHKIKQGDTYVIIVPDPSPPLPKAQHIDLDIVYEDDDLLVINKCAGMVVHPGAGNPDQTLVNALISHCGESLSGIGGVQKPGIVHRLDKETSGLIVIAKNDFTHQKLSEQFVSRTLSRTYVAFIWGRLIPLAGIIETNIGRHPHHRQKMAVLFQGGKEAITHYTTLKISSEYPISFIECNLKTGRTHQIRVHLAHKKHPILADIYYGQNKPHPKILFPELSWNEGRQALHAKKLSFIHPRLKETLIFETPLPQDLAQLYTLIF